jgi:trehalose synthase
MWKKRALVASGIGGILDQVVDGESGVLLADPCDLDSFGDAVADLLADPARRRSLGEAAHRRVCDHFLPMPHFEKEAAVFANAIEASGRPLAT